MRTTIETLSDIELRVAVELPSDAVDREIDSQLKRLRGKATIKGFRAGKAPLAMVEKLYRQQVASDAAMKLIEGSMAEAIGAVDRAIVAQPQMEPALAQRGENLTYHLRVEVKPQIKIQEWKGLQITQDVRVDLAEKISVQIGLMAARAKERVPVENRGAQTTDLVVLGGTGALDGEPDERLSIEGLEVTIGSGHMIPGFEDQLLGAKVGDELEISVAFPEDYNHAEMAGRPAVFQATIEGLFTEETPEIDDDFAKDAGFESLDALSDDVRAQLTESEEKERREERDEKAIKLLLERHPFAAPASMIRGQYEHSAQRLVMMLLNNGLPRDQAISMARENTEPMFKEAEEAVRRFLILEAVAEAEGLSVDDEALTAEIAKRTEKDGEQAATHYEREDAREGLRLELIERAVLDLVCEHATISQAEPDDSVAPDVDSDVTHEQTADTPPEGE